MKKVVVFFVVAMVVALVFASVFGYKTDSFTDAFSGLEEIAVFVSSVSENALAYMKNLGNLPEVISERWNEKWGSTDYEMPAYYKRLCGDTTYSVRDLINKVFPNSGYANAWNEQQEIIDGVNAALLEKSVVEVWLYYQDRGYICKEDTAKALYYYDLYCVVSGYKNYAAKGEDTPQAVKEEMFAAYCRIEGVNQNIFNRQQWRWSSAKRGEYALRYENILVECDESLLVWVAPWNNIAYYEFGVFVLPDEDGNYAESTPDTAFFNVKNYGN